MDRPTTKEVARFFDKVQITKHCWLWEAQISDKGYGQFKFHGSGIPAHRFSYQLFVGPIEPGKMILHRRECGNRSCVNPNHLYMGTNADNVRDRELWGNPGIGEKHGRAKLSESNVLAVRRIHKDKRCGYAETAESFGVTPALIGSIVRGRLWRHLPLEDPLTFSGLTKMLFPDRKPAGGKQ